MADPIRAALERAARQLDLAGDVLLSGSFSATGGRIRNEAHAARTALAAEPLALAPTINDILQLCEDHEFHLGGDGADEEESAESLLQIILVALARWGDQPPAPDHLRTATKMVGDGEREELAQWLEGLMLAFHREDDFTYASHCLRAAALLRQPAPAPVSVSERPWEREGWCDAEGRCWLRGKVEGDWRLMYPINSGVPQLRYCFDFSLPHWAIPIPQPPQGGEVAE